MEIRDIYRIQFMKDRFNYVGTLRNEKQFNLFDDVFFAYNGTEIFRGRIVGVELPPTDNPNYIYKIQLTEDLIRGKMDNDDFYEGRNFDKVELTCAAIFTTIEEAEESARKNLQGLFELQSEEIDRYFGQFKRK